LVAEVKRMINNRPLAQSYMETDEHVQPVCPNDLIYGHPIHSLPYSPRPERAGGDESLLVGWQNRQRILNSFQTIFMDQWIKTLQENRKWQLAKRNIQVGDLVLINAPTKKRNRWPVGWVVEVLEGRDGLVRSCVLRIHDSNKKSEDKPQGKLITRSVRSLVFLKTLPEGVQAARRMAGPSEPPQEESPPESEED